MPQPIDYLGAMGGLQGIANPGGALIGGMQAGEEMLMKRKAMALQEQIVQQKLMEQQRQQQRDAEYQQMVQQFLRNPSAQAAADLQILFPDKREAIKAAWDTQSEDVKASNLRQLGGIFSALNAGRTDLAKKSLEDRIAAERQAGRPTEDYEMLLDAIESDPNEAKGLAGFLLASVVGPEKYATVLEELRLAQNGGDDFTLGPGDIRFGPDGKVVASSPYRPEIIRDPVTGAIYQLTPGGGDPASGMGGGGNIPTVSSPEEAKKLAPGTVFRTPDGRTLRVPGGPTQSASGGF